MATLTELMEKIAAALPGGTGGNQSTATAAYCKGNATLYLTHQGNRSYDSILTAPSAEASTNIFGGHKKVTTIHSNLSNWLKEFRNSLPAQGDWRAAFDVLLDQLNGIKVVMNADLFVTNATVTSGFHGESRIIRHLFLKYLRVSQDEDILSPKLTSESITKLNDKFAVFFQDSLYFGSSQGACSYCAKYMKRLGIRYTTLQAIEKERDDTWIHPITMTTKASGYREPATKSLYVAATAAHRQQFREEAAMKD